jgi:predicted aspartyl protease
LLRLAFDTGAGETIIAPGILDELGYNPRQGEAITVIRSVVGREHGYMIRVERFECLGYQARNFRVNAQDLPEGWNIEGLVGLSFLRQFNYEVRSVEGRIRVERAVS